MDSKFDLIFRFFVSRRIFYLLLIFFYDKYWASYDPISEKSLYKVSDYSLSNISDCYYPISLKICRLLLGIFRHLLCYKCETLASNAHWALFRNKSSYSFGLITTCIFQIQDSFFTILYHIVMCTFNIHHIFVKYILSKIWADFLNYCAITLNAAQLSIFLSNNNLSSWNFLHRSRVWWRCIWCLSLVDMTHGSGWVEQNVKIRFN